MYSNIIRLPERDIKNNEIYKNYWILYEESYKNNVNLNNFILIKLIHLIILRIALIILIT